MAKYAIVDFALDRFNPSLLGVWIMSSAYVYVNVQDNFDAIGWILFTGFFLLLFIVLEYVFLEHMFDKSRWK